MVLAVPNRCLGIGPALTSPSGRSTLHTLRHEYSSESRKWRRENPLVEVLESIRRVGRFRLQVDADAKPLLDRRITVKFADATVEEALAIVLRAGKLTYRVLDDQTVQILKPQQ